MKYRAPTKQFTIEKDSLEIVSLYLMYAIRNIRDLAELPRTPHKHDGGA